MMTENSKKVSCWVKNRLGTYWTPKNYRDWDIFKSHSGEWSVRFWMINLYGESVCDSRIYHSFDEIREHILNFRRCRGDFAFEFVA